MKVDVTQTIGKAGERSGRGWIGREKAADDVGGEADVGADPPGPAPGRGVASLRGGDELLGDGPPRGYYGGRPKPPGVREEPCEEPSSLGRRSRSVAVPYYDNLEATPIDGLSCLDDLTTKFIQQGSSRGLDTSCVASIKRRGFQLALNK